MKKSAIAALALSALVLFTGCGSTPKKAGNDTNAKPAATEQVKPAAGKPVLIHCRKAIFAPNAYKRVVELRPDIPEISYINGAPLIQPYNEWKSTQGN